MSVGSSDGLFIFGPHLDAPVAKRQVQRRESPQPACDGHRVGRRHDRRISPDDRGPWTRGHFAECLVDGWNPVSTAISSNVQHCVRSSCTFAYVF